MKKLVPFLLFVLMAVVAGARQDNEISIIPVPVSLEKKNGTFDLSSSTRIELKGSSANLLKVARYLTEYLMRSTGYNLSVQSTASSENRITLDVHNGQQ